MNPTPKILLFACCILSFANSHATERIFTYTYEPETMPKGGMEYEQWLTLRAGRNQAVGQDQYQRWDLRHEFEYGISDNYTLSLYVNETYETFRQSPGNHRFSDFRFEGVSLENKYQVLDPAKHAVGLSLYLEPRFSGDETELEEKVILGQRHGNWKWAFNLTHATEWNHEEHETEGELEVSCGIARQFGPHWSIGLEARDHNELPEYKSWENTAFYLGPVVSYRREHWWAALTVMPQLFGANFSGNVDANHHLELEGHERWNARLIVGISF